MPADHPAADPILEAPPARKPPRRIWLYLPFVLIALALIGYSGFWFTASSRLSQTLDARAESLRQAGYVVEAEGRRVSGFPFRLKVAYGAFRVAGPSGWAVAAPAFEAEAYLHNLKKWAFAAPQGLTFTRPEGGPVALAGERVHGSAVDAGPGPWRIVLQARKARFTPAPGARPFSLASAELVEFYIRPSATPDQGQFLFRIDAGKGGANALLGQIAGDGAVSASIEGQIAKTGAFKGASWGEAVRAWRQAGGALEGVRGTAAAGAFAAKTQGGTLSIGSDGRLVGALPLELRQADRALTALAETAAVEEGAAGSAAAVAAARAKGEATTVNLVFQAGVMTFGPVKLGPAPRVG